MKPELYLLVYVGPTGFNWVDVTILAKKPDNLYQYGKGEGQTLLFKLDSYDVSQKFYSALEEGRVQKDFSGKNWSNLNLEQS
jgi:hypothetical protein